MDKGVAFKFFSVRVKLKLSFICNVELKYLCIFEKKSLCRTKKEVSLWLALGVHQGKERRLF